VQHGLSGDSSLFQHVEPMGAIVPCEAFGYLADQFGIVGDAHGSGGEALLSCDAQKQGWI
jgi:hypothetical protein